MVNFDCLLRPRHGDVAGGDAADRLSFGDRGDLLRAFDEERDRVVDGDNALDDCPDRAEHRHQLVDQLDDAGHHPVLNGAQDYLLEIADSLDYLLPGAAEAFGDQRLDNVTAFSML